jgi:5-methylcytosine-specific restriction protein A
MEMRFLMPSRVPTFNPHPSVRPESRKLYDRTRRDREAKAFYHTTRWLRTRRIKLAMVPYCERCMQDDRLTPATVVHHLQELADHPELAVDLDNLQSLCASCHSKWHAGAGG